MLRIRLPQQAGRSHLCSNQAQLHHASLASGPRPSLPQRHHTSARQPWRAVLCNGAKAQIPIFPLGLIAMPCATIPLMIFEARYRVLFNTLLAGSPGVEEGLVVADSPFNGTKLFGMCYCEGGAEGKPDVLASVGTTLEITEFTHSKEGRIYLTTKGRRRFRILDVAKTTPVLICNVEMLDEEDDENSAEVKELAHEVADLLRRTLKLNVKLNNIQATDDQLEPVELVELGPRDLSFWVASFFQDVKYTQQSILEENSLVARLTKERDVLSESAKFYAASIALKSLEFNSTDGGGAASVATAGGSDDDVVAAVPEPPSAGPSAAAAATAATASREDGSSSSSGSDAEGGAVAEGSSRAEGSAVAEAGTAEAVISAGSEGEGRVSVGGASESGAGEVPVAGSSEPGGGDSGSEDSAP